MSSRILNLLPASRRSGRGFARLAQKFARRKDGTAVIEFAIVIVPFLALMFAIIETALVFYAGQVLETAAADSARLIMTGQAQKQTFTEAQFKSDVCGRLLALFNCDAGVKIDVKKYASFPGSIQTPPLDADGDLDTSSFGFQPGVQGDIVVVRVVYEWPTFVRQFGLDLATLPNGKHLLMSTAAFRNEPYSN
ncbi:MAG: TadE/TadG family type IV pilus assembly protein [Xanthobacteraceae bacterium]